MIVRVVLWSLGDAKASLDEVRDRVDELEPLTPPSIWLVNEAAERFGAILYLDEEVADLPEPLAGVRGLVGKDPEVWEEFDAL